LGLLISRYAQIPADHTRAVHALERGCAPRQPVACAQLAHRLLEGRGTPKDAPRARRLLEVACAGGMTPACRMMKAMGAP
jgi:TPR repeat protein